MANKILVSLATVAKNFESPALAQLGEAILNLSGQIDSLLPEGPVIICFIIPLCFSKEKNYYFNWKLISSTTGLVTKKTHTFE